MPKGIREGMHKISEEKIQRFRALFKLCMTVPEACLEIGISRRSYYHLAKLNENFSENVHEYGKLCREAALEARFRDVAIHDKDCQSPATLQAYAARSDKVNSIQEMAINAIDYGEDPKQMAFDLVKSAASGDVMIEHANAVVNTISTIVRIEEATELKDRIAALELLGDK